MSFGMEMRPGQGMDRAVGVWESRMAESRVGTAGKIQEMGNNLEGAMERIYSTREDAGLEQEIGNRLRLMGVLVQRVFLYGVKGKRRQLYVTMRTKKKNIVPVKKIAQGLTEIVEREMRTARDRRSFVTQDRTTVLIVDGMAYHALYGSTTGQRIDNAERGDRLPVLGVTAG